MTYEEAIQYLEQRQSFGIKPGLERIHAIAEALGHPEKAYRTVHVTGTNGKGSVTAYLHEAVLASGLKVGRFTSPHLVDYTERIRVGRDDVSQEKFAELVSRVKEVVEALEKEGLEAPTTFEILTAAAFLYFKEEAVDYAIIEAGMGGRLDSTNIITPEVSVITNVTIDHTAYCGDTVDAIAAEKAGIIKEGVPVVTAAQGSPLRIIEEKAEEMKAKTYVFDRNFAVTTRHPMPEGQMVTVEWRDNAFPKVMLVTRMSGVHQAVNVACAAMAMALLIKNDARLNDDGMRLGFAGTIWPGRFEIIHALGRTFILDGAHNAGGAEAFANTYEEKFKDTPKTVVFSVLKDKELGEIVRYCIGPKDQVVTVPAPTERTSDPKELAGMMPCTACAEDSVTAGMEKALSMTKDGDIIAICGSLYILGEAKKYIIAKTAN